MTSSKNLGKKKKLLRVIYLLKRLNIFISFESTIIRDYYHVPNNKLQ